MHMRDHIRVAGLKSYFNIKPNTHFRVTPEGASELDLVPAAVAPPAGRSMGPYRVPGWSRRPSVRAGATHRRHTPGSTVNDYGWSKPLIASYSRWPQRVCGYRVVTPMFPRGSGSGSNAAGPAPQLKAHHRSREDYHAKFSRPKR